MGLDAGADVRDSDIWREQMSHTSPLPSAVAARSSLWDERKELLVAGRGRLNTSRVDDTDGGGIALDISDVVVPRSFATTIYVNVSANTSSAVSAAVNCPRHEAVDRRAE